MGGGWGVMMVQASLGADFWLESGLEMPSVVRSQAIPKPNQLKAAAYAAAVWAWSLTDVVPPYYTCEGKLMDKKVAPDGGNAIRVNGAWLAVDDATCKTLEVGERLRVRYTRRARAISIDRLAD